LDKRLWERTVGSTEVFAGRLVRLRVDEVELPDGSRSRREVVEHPGASAVVPLDAARRVLLVAQYRHAVGRVMYEIPAGRLDRGEAPLECARRELAEETGCVADGWDELCRVYTSPGFTSECIAIYLATGLRPVEVARPPGEMLQVVRLPLQEACDRFRRGEWPGDAKSLIGLMEAAARLGPEGGE